MDLGWKLINENKELEGLILNIPFIFKHKKQEILAAVCSNYVINKNYRAHSLKLRYLFLNQPNVDLYNKHSKSKIRKNYALL